MKILLDADIHRSGAFVHKKLRHEMLDVRDIDWGVATDDEIVNYAKENNFVSVTRDIEFANVLRYPAGSHVGIEGKIPWDSNANEEKTTEHSYFCR